MSIKKTIPKNDSEAIEMLASVVSYLKNNSKNRKKNNLIVRKVRRPVAEKKDKSGKDLQPADVIDLFASKGKDALKEHLNALDIAGLRKIISTYGFDKSRISKDWKDKDKFVNLILQRVESMISKGESFKY